MKKFAISSAILIIFWLLMFPWGIWKYRLTLEVNSPDGLKTGSSVVRISSGLFFGVLLPIATGASVSHDVLGEAVTVDLGPRGLLFGLLKSEASEDNAHRIVPETFPMPKPFGAASVWTSDGVRYYRSLVAPRTDLALRNIPMLVRFRDVKDPMTIEPVHPNELSAAFGPGVSLKRATIEMVDAGWWPLNLIVDMGEPVTTGIERRFPSWFTQQLVDGTSLDGNRNNGGSSSKELSNTLSVGYFKRIR
jgi:hypothetical protein